VGLRITLGFLTISPSRVSPFNHIGTLPLQRKHSQPRVPLLVPPFILTGHAYLELFARKTFDTGTLLHSSEPILTIGSDTTLSGFTEGVSLGRTTPMRSEPNHIRHWHHSQPKTLRQWVYGPWSLYGALLSQYWSMCFAIFFFFILRIQKIMLNFYLFNIEKLKKKWKKTIITMELFFRTSCCEISIYRINKIWE